MASTTCQEIMHNIRSFCLDIVKFVVNLRLTSIYNYMFDINIGSVLRSFVHIKGFKEFLKVSSVSYRMSYHIQEM